MDLAVTGWAGPQVVGTGKGQPLLCSFSSLAISLHVFYLPEKFLWELRTAGPASVCPADHRAGPEDMLRTHVPEAAGTDAALERCSPGADCCTARSKQISLCGGKRNTCNT